MSKQHYVSHYQYIHEVFGCFFSGLASFFSDALFDNSTKVIIATYLKAVEHFKSRSAQGGEEYVAKRPFVTLDPSLDFDVEERSGLFLHNYPNYATWLAAKVYGPDFYNDDNIQITPILNRYTGTFNLIVWCRSVYEYLDLKMLTLQFFTGGRGRVIYPKNIDGYFILPNNFLYYTYDNPYTKETYEIDWSQTQSEASLIKTINQEKMIFPFSLTPHLSLESVSDASTKYGADDLSDYKLSIDIKWECDLPTHLVMISKKEPILTPQYFFEINMGTIYNFGDARVPKEFRYMYADDDEAVTLGGSVEFKNRIDYIITDDDVDLINSGEDLPITIEENKPDIIYKIRMYLNGEKMEPGNCYAYNSDTGIVSLMSIEYKDSIKKDDLISMFIYD